VKRPFKTILITAGVIAGIIFILIGAVFAKYYYEVSKMAPIPSGEVREGVIAIQDEYVNFYLVRGEDGYVAFDAGYKKDNVEKELKKLNIDPRQVKAVFLTHTDLDHVGALPLFVNARVFISDQEEQMVNGETSRFFGLMKNSLPVRYELVRDSNTVEIAGVEVEGIWTPGHTPGSICYLVNWKHLFTGDNMSLKDGKAEPFNEFFNMDSKMQGKSLAKLKDYPEVQFVYTAHYGQTENSWCFQ